MSEEKKDDRFIYNSGQLELTKPGEGPLLFGEEDDDDDGEPEDLKKLHGPPRPKTRAERGLVSRLVRGGSK